MATSTPTVREIEKSTNGRVVHAAPRWLVQGFRILARIWPGGTERFALWLFCRPRKARMRPHEAAVLGTGERMLLPTTCGSLHAWSWGRGPVVLLHHGWGGHAGQMTAFVAPLVKAGFRVVAYDAAAHGESPGWTTSGPDLARALRQVATGLGDVHAVVAHSMGSVATLLAVAQGLDLTRVVVLAPPSDMRVYFRAFGDHLELSPRIQAGMRRRAASRFDFSWSDMRVEGWARPGAPPLLVCHDKTDPVVPLASAQRIVEVWEGAELLTTSGLGHNGVRRDPAVVAEVVDFTCRPAAVAVEAAR